MSQKNGNHKLRRTTSKAGMFLILLIMLFVSCERKYVFFEFNCEDCYQEKPETGPLIIYFSFNEENKSVPFTIYKGRFENGIEVYSDTAYSLEEQIEVPVSEYYSVEAKYLSGADTIYVIDGDRFKLKRETEECDKTCYYYEGGIIDVRLRK